jgi:hypothetical protein
MITGTFRLRMREVAGLSDTLGQIIPRLKTKRLWIEEWPCEALEAAFTSYPPNRTTRKDLKYQKFLEHTAAPRVGKP